MIRKIYIFTNIIYLPVKYETGQASNGNISDIHFMHHH